MADDKTIFWIIGLVIAGALLYHYGGQLGLFSTQEICTSNEPTSLEGYQAMCNWTIGNESNTKCHLSQEKPSGNDFEVVWGSGIGDVGEGDAVIIVKSDIVNGMPSNLSLSTRMRSDVPILYFIWEGKTYNLLCSKNKATYKDDNGTKQDFLCLYYINSEIENKYFDTFYTCQEPQKCYSYLAETCQEVPCSSNYVKFNTLLDCQNYYKPSCCGYWVINNTCVPIPECFTCPTTPLNLTECNKQIIEGGTCESKGGFEIGTLCVTIPILLIIIVIIIVIGGFIILNRK